jgi:hypothetical protein
MEKFTLLSIMVFNVRLGTWDHTADILPGWHHEEFLKGIAQRYFDPKLGYQDFSVKIVEMTGDVLPV